MIITGIIGIIVYCKVLTLKCKAHAGVALRLLFRMLGECIDRLFYASLDVIHVIVLTVNGEGVLLLTLC